ncbi:helix-turn-helix domain-containing protein [Rhodoferax antarcticus]|uniref:helix-turn-helix domain-containing protein n=1 Tax=Rhodoferax antarcticus TaxID=81479 RepID=UPI002224314B|nr:helix-turn-helix domain-containing protein [Rhodoferax antarcticus]
MGDWVYFLHLCQCRRVVCRGCSPSSEATLTPAQIDHARQLIDQENRTVKDAAELLGVHRSTLYRALDRS